MFTTGVCVAGECKNACETAEDCNDGNDCTEEDACPIDGGGVCDSTSVADGTTCAGGLCQGGACELTGSVLPCSEQGIRNAVAAGGGPYTFDCGGPTTVVTRATIEVDKDVILDGEGNLTVDGNKDHTVFSFRQKSNGCLDTPPCEGEARAELSGVTVTGGIAGTDSAIWNRDCANLELTRSSVSGNAGRGIENGGTLTLTDVTVSDSVQGILNNGILTMTNSTVSGNTASGGVWNSATLTMTNCTVSGNTDGDIVFEGGTVTMTNTLVDGACVDVEPRVVSSNGYNIESPGNSCGFDQGTDQVDVTEGELNLEPLQENGGPTETHALGADSVAIDVIPEADCDVDTDQRGEPRDSMCDVGAFEVQP